MKRYGKVIFYCGKRDRGFFHKMQHTIAQLWIKNNVANDWSIVLEQDNQTPLSKETCAGQLKQFPREAQAICNQTHIYAGLI